MLKVLQRGCYQMEGLPLITRQLRRRDRWIRGPARVLRLHRYGRENIVESYYNWHAWRGLFYAVDVQHIANPGYNRDRGPAWVGSVRAHVDF
jgi:carbohydrate-selective porin OprB